MRSTIYLVTGSTGAGKTTYAIGLAARERALRLSIDEWMTSLFGPDQTGPLHFEWMMERVDRCEAQMWAIARQVAALDLSIVVDCGLTREAHRAKWGKLAAEAGLSVQLHHLDVDVEERWRRVQGRNAERGPTYRLEVTREMFDFVETLWERPSDEELSTLNGRRIDKA